MGATEITRRHQLLREAEGYLDLLLIFADRWPPERTARDRIARRALGALDRLGRAGDVRGHAAYLRGQAYRLMERHAQAVGPLRKAVENDPTNIHIHLALGWCYKRMGRLDLAIQALEEGMAVDPSQGIIHYNLACYWSLAKNASLALEYLVRSIGLDPTYRDLVPDEPDFDPIRDDPEFVALTTTITPDGQGTRGG